MICDIHIYVAKCLMNELSLYIVIDLGWSRPGVTKVIEKVNRRSRSRFFPTQQNRQGLISVTGSVTNKNCSQQSWPEMSITSIKFKIQCSIGASFLNCSQDTVIFLKPRKLDILYTNKLAYSMPKFRIYYNHYNHIFFKMILSCESCIEI